MCRAKIVSVRIMAPKVIVVESHGSLASRLVIIVKIHANCITIRITKKNTRTILVFVQLFCSTLIFSLKAILLFSLRILFICSSPE